jgi:methyl-accepting chemotaxis protein
VTSREVEEIKAHFDGSVAEVKGHFDRVGGELRAQMGQTRDSVRADVGELRVEMGQMRDSVRADVGELRQGIADARTVAEAVNDDLRKEIRLVADGVALANERIDRLDLRVDDLTGEMRRGFALVRADIRRLHETDDQLRQRIEGLESQRA